MSRNRGYNLKKRKKLDEMKALFNWRGKAFLEGIDMPPFTLVYHESHPEYDYDEEHYHIEISTGCFLSQYDLKCLIEENLGIIISGYVSVPGGHFHIFEEEDVMNQIVTDLNELFELSHLMS